MQKNEDKEGHFANYAEYSKTLRTWLVAYGVGGPVLLLLNKEAPAKIASSPLLGQIVTFFVVGVALQILLAFINKWAAWQLYKGSVKNAYKNTRSYKFWNWVNNQSWIDFFIDLGAMVLFLVATWISLNTLLSAAITQEPIPQENHRIQHPLEGCVRK